jgi:hypothetical protein
MPTNDDMTTPLTRRDFEEALDQRLASYASRTELEEILERHPTRAELRGALGDLRVQIAADTRATMTVLLEDAFKRFRVIDDQYKDLPRRVQRLEEVVFPAPPRARRKRSG